MFHQILQDIATKILQEIATWLPPPPPQPQQPQQPPQPQQPTPQPPTNKDLEAKVQATNKDLEEKVQANKDLEEKVKELQKALEQKEVTNNLEEKVKELQKALEKKEVELEREGFQNLRVGDVKPFDGTQANWIKWKNEAEGVLHGTGFQKVMESREEADKDQNRNNVLFSTLSSATCAGSAFSKVNRFKGKNDGYGAWNQLLAWYDSATRLESHADTLRIKIQHIRLYDGGSITDYVNRFELVYHELQRIPTFGMLEIEAKGLFIRNILDSSLDYTRRTLFRNKTKMTLEEMIQELRTEEEEIARRSIFTKGQVKRRQEPTLSFNTDAKRARLGGDLSLAGTVLHPNKIGILRIHPESGKI